MSNPPTPPDPSPGGRRPFGLLALVAVAAVVGAVALFGGGRDTPTTTSLPDDTRPGLLPPDPPASGEAAPDFTISLIDGTSFTLSDHLAGDGRPVFLNLWASWCIPCRAEMPAIDRAAAANPDVFFLGVAVEDDPVEAEEFAREIGVSYALAIDERDRVNNRYPAFGLPATFFITSDGTIAHRVFGELTEDMITALLDEHVR